VSVFERTVDGLELAHLPAQTAPAGAALVDIREATPAREPASRLADARVLVRTQQQLAVAADVVAGGVASALATTLRFGTWREPDYIALSLAVPVLWVLLVTVKRAYEHRVIERAAEEYRRLWEAGLLLFITMAVLSYSIKGDVARGYVFVVVPLTIVASCALRGLLRLWVRRLRTQGLGVRRVLVVGPAPEARTLFDRLHDEKVPGLRPVAVYPHHANTDGVTGVLAAVDASGAHMVAVVADPELSGQALRELSWELEERHVDLVVDPGLVDVASPRLSIHPMADLSLLHVHRTRPSGERVVAKAVFDAVFAALAVIVLSPVFVALAVAVKATSRGPVLFRQKRVGVDGREFTMLKFRSMVPDADQLIPELSDEHDGNEVLFKLRDDPRVTRVGRVLRRYSLDELPQLFNVLSGHMSLVGPRPPLPSEVAAYDYTAYRRLRLRPGLTGLWQVSGRSDLSWDESLRLDLRYVDNWSMALDLQILLRTFRAVVRGAGAY
jgi:exopolysaccharide biosynthesis polyprenyl glycosylphosphotransferase